MSTPWNSSPIRSQPDLESVEGKQKLRAHQLYRPMSSPIKLRCTEDRVPGSSSRDHLKVKSKELREQRRQTRLENSREKVTDILGALDKEAELLREANVVEVDLDQLIEEEEKCKSDLFVKEEQEEQFVEELESILAQEQAELELLLKELSL